MKKTKYDATKVALGRACDKPLTLSVGDTYGDGHSQTQEYHFLTNLTTPQIETAFKQGTKTLKLDITKRCRDYEDCTISIDQYNAFLKAGYVPIPNEFGDTANEQDDLVYLSTWDYTDIYLFTVKIGNPSFQYLLQSNTDNTLAIGGYGLFNM